MFAFRADRRLFDNLLSILLLGLFLLVLTRNPAHAQGNDQQDQGAQLFTQNCAVCHGPQGQGRIGATLAKDWPSIRPDLTVRTIIANGVPGSPMPAWSQANGGPLTEAEIDALVAYILSWSTGGAPQITPFPTATQRPPISPVPDVAGDPNHGAVLFGENCAMCHGPNGEGRIGATLAKNWPSIRPDLTIRAAIAGGVPGSPMPAWSQASGGPLSETEVNDLVAFVMTLGENSAVQAVTPQAPLSQPGQPSLLSGWGGVVLFIVLFGVIVGGAILLQRRYPSA